MVKQLENCMFSNALKFNQNSSFLFTKTPTCNLFSQSILQPFEIKLSVKIADNNTKTALDR